MTNPASMSLPSGRIYLRGSKPAFDTPRWIANHRFALSRCGQVHAFGEGDVAALGDSDATLDLYGIESRLALQHLHAVVTGFRLGSQCRCDVVGYWLADVGYLGGAGPTLVWWGHYADQLSTDAVAFAERHYRTIEAVSLPETYSRFSNALRLYTQSLHTQNPDLALLGFVGSLESLFAIAPQELSFRLALLLARFLGENPQTQRHWFDRARELYTVRSKVAHGDKIAESEEGAAIQITEHWTPEAEEIARLSICRVLDFDLVDLFNNKKRHQALLTNLLFLPSLKDAITATP